MSDRVRIKANSEEWYPVPDPWADENGDWTLPSDFLERFQKARKEFKALLEEYDRLEEYVGEDTNLRRIYRQRRIQEQA